MGKRGPQPQPTEKKVKKGETRPVRTNQNKVRYKSRQRVPEPPTSLGQIGKAEWKERARDLKDAGLLQKADEAHLKRWCESVEMAEVAYKHLQEEGSVVTHPDRGTTYLNPWHNVYTSAWRTMKEVSAKFGFNPVDRENLQPDQENKDKGNKGPSF